MQNSIWKLTALAGVVGIGCLVVMQAMRGLSENGANAANRPAAIADFDSEGGPVQDSAELGEAVPLPGSTDVAVGQFEPEPQDEPSPFEAEPSEDRSRTPSQPERILPPLSKTGIRMAAAGEEDAHPFGAPAQQSAPQQSEPELFPTSSARPLSPQEIAGNGPTSVPVNLDDPPPAAARGGAPANDDPFGASHRGGAQPASFEESPTDRGRPAEGGFGETVGSRERRPSPAEVDDANPFGVGPFAADAKPLSESPANRETPSSPGPQLLGPAGNPFGADQEPAEDAFEPQPGSAPSAQSSVEPRMEPEPVAPEGFGLEVEPRSIRPRPPAVDSREAVEVEENPFGGAPARVPNVSAPEPVENPFGGDSIHRGDRGGSDNRSADEPLMSRGDDAVAPEVDRPMLAPPNVSDAPFGSLETPASEPEPLESSPPRGVPRPEPVPFRTGELPPADDAVPAANDAFGAGGDEPLEPTPEPEDGPIRVPRRERYGDSLELSPRPEESRAGSETPFDLGSRPAPRSGLPMEDSREPAPLRAGEVPNQLQPPPVASRLVPAEPEDLLGEGTVTPSAPRGVHRPQLSIEKSAPPNAVLGQPLIYTILVRNSGNTAARDVVVEDEIPKGTQLSGTIPQAELVDKKLVWQLGTLKPREERKIQVRIVPLEEGQVGSIATVNFVSEVAAETRVVSPHISLELTGPKQAPLGQSISFHFKVTNTGQTDAQGVIVRNIIPDELKHPAGNDLEYEVGTLRAGETREIDLAVTAVKAGRTTNRAIATFEGGAEVSAVAELEVVGSKISLQRSGPRQRYLGRPATYVNKVTNASSTPVSNLTVVETLPPGMEFVRTGGGGQYNAAKRTVAWSIPNLGPNESLDLELVLIAKAAGTQVSSVVVYDQHGQRVQVESKTNVGGIAALSASVGGVDGPLAVGDGVTFQVKIRNRGTKAAANVGLRVIVPEELELITARGPDRYTSRHGDVTFLPVASLAPQQEATYTLQLKALRAGDARVKVQIDADDMQQPLNKEEAVVIFSDQP